MRTFVIALVVCSSVGIAVARQQPRNAVNPAAAVKLFASSDELAALVAKVKKDRKPGQPLVTERVVGLAPHDVVLQYHPGVFTAAIHEREAELFYVLEG